MTYITYEDVERRMQVDAPGTSEVLASQIRLFGTWAELREYDLEAALARLDEYRLWLEAWEFPARLAEATVAQLRARAVALGYLDGETSPSVEEAT